MSVTDLDVALPPGVAAWTDRVIYLFLGLFILWVVLKVAGYFLRRAYNLTPVATASGKGITPDFLKVDHRAQKAMLERGREFDRAAGVAKAAVVTNWGVLATGTITVLSAAFLALGRIEEFDQTWQKLSAKDRFVAIVESHPVGFAIALAMIAAAVYRLIRSARMAKQ